MDAAEQDVLACMDVAPAHWVKLYSTNPIGRPSGEIKRRTNVVGIFPTRRPPCRRHAARVER
jgi:putative transposase